MMRHRLSLLRSQLYKSWPGNFVPWRLFWCPVNQLGVPVGEFGALLINGGFLFGEVGFLLISWGVLLKELVPCWSVGASCRRN